MIWSYLLLAVANFMYIGLKSFQQRNVAHLHYVPAVITNAFLVGAELYVIGKIAYVAINLADPVAWTYTFLSMMIGGGTGMLFSMWTHSKYIGRSKK